MEFFQLLAVFQNQTLFSLSCILSYVKLVGEFKNEEFGLRKCQKSALSEENKFWIFFKNQ